MFVLGKPFLPSVIEHCILFGPFISEKCCEYHYFLFPKKIRSFFIAVFCGKKHKFVMTQNISEMKTIIGISIVSFIKRHLVDKIKIYD
jgi:hypothetical protein